MFRRVRMMERLATLSLVVMPEDTTQVAAKGVEGTAPVGVVAAAEVARGICPREGNMMTFQVQAERITRRSEVLEIGCLA